MVDISEYAARIYTKEKGADERMGQEKDNKRQTHHGLRAALRLECLLRDAKLVLVVYLLCLLVTVTK